MLSSFRCFFFILFVIRFAPAQSPQDRVQPLHEKYQTFEYQEVIREGDLLLKQGQQLSQFDSLNILRLQGLSYFALSDMAGALRCFVSILRINPVYQMNLQDNPPKVINFFEEIRNELKQTKTDGDSSGRSANQPDYGDHTYDAERMNKIIGYSLLVPGLGHLQSGNRGKGWILLSSGVITLGSSIYFAVEAEKKEDAYLQAVDKDDIAAKYDDFNHAYKLRNASLILYAAVWIYAQLDLLYWSDTGGTSVALLPGWSNPNGTSLTLQVRF